MRGQRAVGSLLLVVLAGCGAEGSGAAHEPPEVGGPDTARVTPPAEAMDRLERSVAKRLNTRLSDDALRLEHVDCPPWHGAVPVDLRCEGYVDGVLGEVAVALTEGPGGMVEFDAVLGDGVVATARLVERLTEAGYAGVDCGSRDAYPARRGLRIVCRGHKDGEAAHVVATVTGRTGAVRIEDY